MSEIIVPRVKDVDPERVYVFPERLTKEEINKKVQKLHTIANEESDRTIYCLFDEIIPGTPVKYEVCFPVSHLDLKKYKLEDFKVIQRQNVVSCDFGGEVNDLLICIEKLTEFAEKEGYTLTKPFRFLFTLHKKPKFSAQPPKFTMEVQIPFE